MTDHDQDRERPDRSAHPFDEGLQPERTALAWRRTALALMIGAVFAFRVLPETLGSWAFAPSSIGLLVAIFLVTIAHTRYKRSHRALTQSSYDHIPLHDGLLPATVAITVSAGGAFGLAGALIAH